MHSCTIIGISDSHSQWFPPEVLATISSGKVFSGGKRHHEIMLPMLPSGAEWIDVTVPLTSVFAQYETHDSVIIFASGDPLFFGFANTVMRELPDCSVTVYPSFNSLQMLAHRCLLPYHDMHVVSLTGRPWHRFDEALIRGEKMIGVLTDKRNTPAAIAQRMLDYGYDNYTIIVGENLGNDTTERITGPLSVADIAAFADPFSVPNCMILQQSSPRITPFGIPESDFHLLNGRAKMITKMPIRLLSLSMLNLKSSCSLWDVGFCTGSVSIEAKLQFPHLHVTAFEIRQEGEALMHDNSRKFGAPGIEAVIGDFLSLDLSQYERPDSVFIGGHGGRLMEMVQRISEVLLPGGCIVFNSVSADTRQLFHNSIAAVGMRITQETLITVDDNNPIYVMKAEPLPLAPSR